MRISSIIPAVVLAVALGAAGTAAADRGHTRFVGIHPIAADYGGGFCYIEVPHVHIYEPTRADVLYRPHDDGHYFVGDPVPYGYEGPKHAFYGPHPIQVDFVLGDDREDTEYCYLEGPHYHPFGPPPQASFRLKGGVYYFAGDLPRVYVDDRPRYVKINAVYKPLRYQRPVIVEAPPPEYRGPVIVEEPTVVMPAPRTTVVSGGPAVRAEAGVGFHAGVSIGLPSVTIGAPAVYVRDEPDVIVVRDRRPRTVVVHEHRHPRTVVVHEHDRGPRVVKVKHKNHNHKHDHKGKGWGRWND